MYEAVAFYILCFRARQPPWQIYSNGNLLKWTLSSCLLHVSWNLVNLCPHVKIYLNFLLFDVALALWAKQEVTPRHPSRTSTALALCRCDPVEGHVEWVIMARTLPWERHPYCIRKASQGSRWPVPPPWAFSFSSQNEGAKLSGLHGFYASFLV